MLRKTLLALSALCLALSAGATIASDEDLIYRGSDLWKTSPTGPSQLYFADHPIPAGFFCSGSAPFTDLVRFRGEPLASEPAGALGNTDTIVERIDDAVFDSSGVATTRIRMRALSMESIEPIATGCGPYHVSVKLEGEQPVTEMTIFRNSELGGYFHAPLELVVRITFTPVTLKGEFRSLRPVFEDKRDGWDYQPLSIVHSLRLPADPDASWTSFPGQGGVSFGDPVKVDSDGNGSMDINVQKTSNFYGGWWDRAGQPSRSRVALGTRLTNALSPVLHLDIHSVEPPDDDGKN